MGSMSSIAAAVVDSNSRHICPATTTAAGLPPPPPPSADEFEEDEQLRCNRKRHHRRKASVPSESLTEGLMQVVQAGLTNSPISPPEAYYNSNDDSGINSNPNPNCNCNVPDIVVDGQQQFVSSAAVNGIIDDNNKNNVSEMQLAKRQASDVSNSSKQNQPQSLLKSKPKRRNSKQYMSFVSGNGNVNGNSNSALSSVRKGSAASAAHFSVLTNIRSEGGFMSDPPFVEDEEESSFSIGSDEAVTTLDGTGPGLSTAAVENANCANNGTRVQFINYLNTL